MSVHVTSWVLRNSKAELGDRLVLLVLADYAGEHGEEARPSVETISEETRLSERQVQRNLRRLEAEGRITQTGVHTSGTRVYQVMMRPDDGADGRGDILSPPPDTEVTPGVTSTTEGGDVGVTRSTQDPPLDPPIEEPSPAAPSSSNIVWDALLEVYPKPTTRSESSNFGKTCSEIRDALVEEGIPEAAWRDEIVRRATSVEERFRTHTSLRNQWSRLGAVSAREEEVPRLPEVDLGECLYCGGSGKVGDEPCEDCRGTGEGTF